MMVLTSYVIIPSATPANAVWLRFTESRTDLSRKCAACSESMELESNEAMFNLTASAGGLWGSAESQTELCLSRLFA